MPYSISFSTSEFAKSCLTRSAGFLFIMINSVANKIIIIIIRIQSAWTELTQKADARKAKLLDSCDYQSYMANSRDLNSWINSMVSQVASEELAKDVPGAEALLERNHVSWL